MSSSGSAIAQLVATGMLNKHTDVADVKMSYFNKVYTQHTPFLKYNADIYSGVLTNNTSHNIANISIPVTLGDLLSDLYIEFEICGEHNLNKFIYGFATGLIKSIKLLIGGMTIDTMTAHDINIYNELWLKETKRQYNDYLCGNKTYAGQKYFIVKLPFFFTKSITNALPLCALYNHNVDLSIVFNSVDSIIKTDESDMSMNTAMDTDMDIIMDKMDNTTLNNSTSGAHRINNLSINYKVIGELIILSETERRLFKFNQLDYVVSLHNSDVNTNITSNAKVPIRSRNLLTECNFMFKYSNNNTGAVMSNDKLLKYADMNNTKMAINLNGLSTSSLPLNHYLINTNSKYHSNIPRTKQFVPVIDNTILEAINKSHIAKTNPTRLSTILNNAVDYIELDNEQYIYTFSYALDPENLNTSTGSLNTVRIDTLTLNLNIPESIPLTIDGYNLQCNIYTTHLNILRFINGMGGLVYSS